ncbi:MAG TPA: M28 family peptidase [Methylomirabilota bacterium]|nr:M28 family peptidase [Methylomirabilota bacterium]
MDWRDVGFYARARLSRGVGRWTHRGVPPPPAPPPLAEVLGGARTPLELTRLLEGRTNPEREAAVAGWLRARGVPFTRERFATFEGSGENFAVDVGRGDRALVLIAHHDAVPGSPGANDNAASVAVLLTLLERWAAREPPARVRLLFPACEELGYLGSRIWVRAHGVGDVHGVLSLELPGVGDSLAVWDAGVDTPFLAAVRGAFEGLGLRPDESYHVIGRIPVFGSDHRAFAAAGVPAYGLSTVPAAEAAALRRFVFRPMRSLLRAGARRPPPFDTYHTAGDTSATLQAAALDRMIVALEAVVSEIARRRA